MAELFSILAKGGLHWYSINGDTSVEVSFCRRLGFFCSMDYYAYLVSKGLAVYQFNKTKKMMEVVIEKDKWTCFLLNKRYGLSAPHNAEFTTARIDMKNLLCGKTQRNDKRYDYHLIRLGRNDSNTYARKISQQEIFLPTIPGWRSKQRYL